MSKYAKFWREQRTTRKMTQVRWGKCIAVSGQFVSNVERGMCAYSLPQTRKLMGHFKLDLEGVLDAILAQEESKIRRRIRK